MYWFIAIFCSLSPTSFHSILLFILGSFVDSDFPLKFNATLLHFPRVLLSVCSTRISKTFLQIEQNENDNKKWSKIYMACIIGQHFKYLFAAVNAKQSENKLIRGAGTQTHRGRKTIWKCAASTWFICENRIKSTQQWLMLLLNVPFFLFFCTFVAINYIFFYIWRFIAKQQTTCALNWDKITFFWFGVSKWNP